MKQPRVVWIDVSKVAREVEKERVEKGLESLGIHDGKYIWPEPDSTKGRIIQ